MAEVRLSNSIKCILQQIYLQEINNYLSFVEQNELFETPNKNGYKVVLLKKIYYGAKNFKISISPIKSPISIFFQMPDDLDFERLQLEKDLLK